MRVLFVSNVFPNPYQPTKGSFNLALVRALARDHEVRVVSPVSWVDECAARWKQGKHLGADRRVEHSGIEVHYPRYYYPPKILRGQYGRFLWHSVARTLRRLIRHSRPEVVLGYWAHPDGEVAVRAARSCGAGAAVLVGGSDVLLLTNERSRRQRILRVFQAADAVIAVGEHLREQITAFGISSDTVHAW